MENTQSNNVFRYELSRYKNLMDEYAKISTEKEYQDWGKKRES